LVSQIRSKKCELIHKLDNIDLKSQSYVLSSSEIDERCHLKAQLQKNLREEELYWLQRAKEMRLLQGDENTKYFQLIANEKHRKKHIFQLEQEEGVMTGNKNLQSYITIFYTNLFGPHEEIREDLTLSMRMSFSRLSSLRKRFMMRFSKWNLIRHQVRMVSRSSFISFFGK
jgi:hypothetical protein